MAMTASFRWREPSILPGFGLALGVTVTALSLIVLIPLTGLFAKAAGAGPADIWAVATSPRTLAALRLSFAGALVAALVNTVFGLILAWVLVRYEFPGRRLIDAAVDLPFALPTAVAGISLAAIYAPNGDNLYSLNDSVSGEKRLNLIVADPIGMASLRASDARAGASEDATTGTTTGAQDGAQPVAPSLGNSIPVEQDIGEGMAVLRVFMPDATWQGEVQRFLDGARCVTLGGG